METNNLNTPQEQQHQSGLSDTFNVENNDASSYGTMGKSDDDQLAEEDPLADEIDYDEDDTEDELAAEDDLAGAVDYDEDETVDELADHDQLASEDGLNEKADNADYDVSAGSPS